ncbi:MAG: hypothetical protein BWZ10_00931 [candidate division BRC1 bacterium ADurb.BinA364]|nr:MAG: hypothetical protein BWZ10_00931 [candidate division BRC1 bacterium ADurb.BinA364]
MTAARMRSRDPRAASDGQCETPRAAGAFRLRASACLGLACALLCGNAAARVDRVRMRDGRLIECKVIQERSAYVEIDTGRALLYLDPSSIEAIEYGETAQEAIRRGDRLLDLNYFDLAIEAFRQAAEDDAGAAQPRIALALRLRREAIENALDMLSGDEDAPRWRSELAEGRASSLRESELLRAAAAKLMERADEAYVKGARAGEAPWLEAAWTLHPADRRIFERRLGAAADLDPSGRQALALLDSRRLAFPDDAQAAEAFAEKIRHRDPWAALRALFPAGLPPSDNALVAPQVAPDLLLECFHDPFPPRDAALSKAECYELYLRYRPGADPEPLHLARIAEDERNPNHQYAYAIFLESRNDLEAALRHCLAALSIDSAHPGAAQSAARIRLELARRRIAEEQQALAPLEALYQAAGQLRRQDFPISGADGVWSDPATTASQVLLSRPAEPRGGDAIQIEAYASALGAYRQRLETSQEAPRQLLARSAREKAEIVARERKEQEERERLRKMDLAGRYLFGEASQGLSVERKRFVEHSRTIAGQPDIREIRIGEFIARDSSGQTVFYAVDLLARNGQVLSATVLVPQ